MSKVRLHLLNRIWHYIRKKTRDFEGKLKHPYTKRSHCEEQLNILLCKRNTNIIKEYIDTIMTVFKNEKTFAIQSRPSIRKVF